MYGRLISIVLEVNKNCKISMFSFSMARHNGVVLKNE